MKILLSRYPEIDLVILTFLLHFAWEILQSPLFSSLDDVSHLAAIRVCLQATLGDVVIGLVAFWAVALLSGRQWIAALDRRNVIVFLAAGLVITVFLEYLNTEILRRWTYDADMPTLPLFGTGLSPILQWIVVPLVALWYLKRLANSEHR
uniref:hypothetical protein n=1 Tax=Pararhizobium sp. IMCC3301 TaxID=3067904 RepID=UPI002741E6FE|nr:hypothetical protein [Pararhizobium sp. IMCC3301]